DSPQARDLARPRLKNCQANNSPSHQPRRARPIGLCRLRFLGALASPHVSHRAISRDVLRLALRGGPAAAPAWRADQDLVSLREHVLAAVVDAAAIEVHIARAAVSAAGEARGGKARALGHEAHDDRALRLALDQDVLTEAAAETARAAWARAETLVMGVGRALGVGHLPRPRGGIAGPREELLAVPPWRG